MTGHWTKTPPDRPGWWWLREMPWNECWVVLVEDERPHGPFDKLIVFNLGRMNPMPVSDLNTEPDECGDWYEWWSEPMEAPDEG